MKLAVVAFKEDEKFNNRPMVQFGAQGGWSNLLSCSGKLTKEQVEVMARVYEEFRSDIWRDKEDCMAWALDSIGIEVEQ